MGSLWRAVRGRPRLFTGLAVMVAAWPLLPSGWPATTRGIVAWDIGGLVFLLLSAQLFATASPDAMPDRSVARHRTGLL